MRARAIAPIVALALTSSCRSDPARSTDEWNPGTREHDFVVGSDDRRYMLHVPPTPRRNRLAIPVGYPLVILLHGSGADGNTVRDQSGMDELADSLHFVVAYPNGATRIFGIGSDWNAGRCCGNAARSNVNDIGFITGIVGDVARHIPIDRRRVYAAGFSDGGRMAYRLGCDASRTFAAIGVVSGSVVDDSCAPARAVPVIAFHGTADTEVPYDDSVAALPRHSIVAESAGLPPSIRFWAAENRCDRVAFRRETPHVVRAQFSPCAGADVVFYSIENGTHAWPGGRKDGPDGFLPTSELRASDAMIAFFFRHPLR